MKPTIGKIVLYTSRYLELGKVEATICPALVTRVDRIEGFESGWSALSAGAKARPWGRLPIGKVLDARSATVRVG